MASTVMSMNESSDDAENVLNAFQAFLNQYSVDESSVLSDSSEYTPGAFVSYSPRGIPSPLLYTSSKNSPRLRQKSPSSPPIVVNGRERNIWNKTGGGWGSSGNETDVSSLGGIAAEQKVEKTTKFDRSFFLNARDKHEREKDDPENICNVSRRSLSREGQTIVGRVGACHQNDMERSKNGEPNSRVNDENSDERTRPENPKDKKGQNGENVNKIYNGRHTPTNEVHETLVSTNFGPHAATGELKLSQTDETPVGEITNGRDEMGNSGSSRRHKSASRADRVRNLHLDSLDSVFTREDEEKNDIHGPSYVHTDNESYVFEDTVLTDNAVYGTNPDVREPVGESKADVRDTTGEKLNDSTTVSGHKLPDSSESSHFSNSETVSTDFRRSDNRNHPTYSAADLVVPELIIDALGDLSDDPTKQEEESPLFIAEPVRARPSTYNDVTLQEQTEITGQSGIVRGNQNRRKEDDDDSDYPIIFRRSKRDPGSKKYQAVVNELSSVLEKRSSGASRSQSMREDVADVEKSKKKESDGRASKPMSRSTESLNVFANKSLLSKLENHLLSKQAKSSNSDNENAHDTYAMINSSPRPEQRQSNYGARSIPTNPPDFHSMPERYDQRTVTNKSATGKAPPDTFGKRVSAKLIYNHSANASADPDRPGHDISFRQDDQLDTSTPRHSGRDHHSNRKGTELTGSKITISSSESNVSKTSMDSRLLQQHQRRQPPQQHQQQLAESHTVGHSLSWARSRDSYVGESNKISNNSGRIYVTSHSSTTGHDKKRRPKHSSSILVTNRRSLDYTTDSSTSTSGSRGHVSTIEISGRGVKRRSTIMYSEPDIYRRASARPSKHSGRSLGSDSFHLVSRTSSSSSPPPPVAISSNHSRHRLHHRPHLLNHNDSWASSRDVSFTSSGLDETGVYYFDQNSLLSSAAPLPMAASGTPTHRLIKVDVAGEASKHSNGSLPRGDDGLDTYFISTSGGQHRAVSLPQNSALVNQQSASSVSMTTIVEHGNRQNYATSGKPLASSVDQTDGVPAWTSVIDQRGHSRPVTVYRAVSLRSQNPPTPRSATVTRSQTLERHQAFSSSSSSSIPPAASSSFRNEKRGWSNATLSPPASDNANLSVHYVDSPRYSSSLEKGQSNVYLFVPPSSLSPSTVPDIIGDHQHHDISSFQHNRNVRSSTSYSEVDKQTRDRSSVHGSPFHQEIFEGVLPPATGDGLHRGEEDKAAVFFIDARGMQGEPSVQVDGPNSIAKCSIDPLKDGQYKVTYIPTEVGLFNAQVRWNGKEIPGSPFHPKVVDPRKVRVVGGWQHYMDSQERVHLVVGEEKVIPFDTSDAGPGQLRAEVKSPSAFIPVSVDDEQMGKSVVKFVPKEEGKHYIHLYWSDHPLVNSPYLGYATSGMADPSKVWLSGRGLKEGVISQENEFFIDGSQAGPGDPEVELTGVRAEVKVFTTSLGGGKYRCTYIPQIPGAYLLHISWNGRQLRGSPYKVNVIGTSHPDRVVVNGEGLKGGLLGQNLDFRIDTRKAGPGELTAYCMGPSKVAYCELSDHHDGTYKLAVRAQEVGRHVLQIKYGGDHVQGSPFSFKVSAQPDASKVRVSGPGVEHGLLANFQSQFIVETKGAGAGQLTVRIRGPKGAFQVEMYRESQKDRTILCRYYPTVTGLYVINVRWSGIDVPGSPFHVHILDTQQELEQILQEQNMMANGHHPNFHNMSSNSINHNRNSHIYQQTSHHMNHNTSRNSGVYQWHD